MKYKIFALLIIGFYIKVTACTIVSGLDTKGQTWVMNNEDFFHTYSNYVNVYPSIDGNSLGYITFTYGSPESGIQGGANEAGVFFDINALPYQAYKLSKGKKPFNEGSMLVYLLQHCKTVPQFLKLWETHYMPGMNDIQIHLADRNGNLAIITPDTIINSVKHLTSTNFNVCEVSKAKQNCWRYPIAETVITENGINKQNLIKIASATSWRAFTTTLYTNIHNLTTGDIWFYLAEDYKTSWQTNIYSLLKRGRQNILLRTKFPKNAGLNLNKLIENCGTITTIKRFFTVSKYSNMQKEAILRLSVLNYFYMEKDFKKASLLFPFWEKYMSVNKRLNSMELKFTKAQYLVTMGNQKQAINVLRAMNQPAGKSNELLKSILNSGDYNSKIELKKHGNAKVVLLEIKGDYNLFRVLTKTPEGWVLTIKTDKNQLKYCFYVDGLRVVDSSQPIIKKQETIKGDFADFNILQL